MAISFNEIPNTRVPFMYVEFDTSKAQQGPSVQQYTGLLIGQRLAAGTKLAEQLDSVSSAAQAAKFYGAGSMLHSMCKAWFDANQVTALKCISLDDDGGSAKAAGDFTLGGSSIEAGTFHLMIGGRVYNVPVAAGDTPAAIVAAAVTLIQADTDRHVDASINATPEICDLDARHGGLLGNDIDFRVNYFSGEELPVNLTYTPTAMSGGTTDPDIADAIAVMTEDQYNIIGHPYTGAANLSALEAELLDRFGPIRQNDGLAISAKADSFANLVTLGDSRNSGHNCIVGSAGPSPSYEWAASLAATAAKFGSIDPARPFQTLPMSALRAPADSERFSFTERDQLLNDGIATFTVDSGGVVRVERLITTYQENSFGSPDTALLDANTLLTLSYLRFDFRSQFQNKYPRHKLGDDGTRFGPGQAVITPKIAKAEAIAIFRGWEELGLVENVDQFKRDILVLRSSSDPNRLEFQLPPDLLNQFRIGAAQIAFLL